MLFLKTLKVKILFGQKRIAGPPPTYAQSQPHAGYERNGANDLLMFGTGMEGVGKNRDSKPYPRIY
jgi:hypothetical protein